MFTRSIQYLGIFQNASGLRAYFVIPFGVDNHSKICHKKVAILLLLGFGRHAGADARASGHGARCPSGRSTRQRRH